MRIEVKKQEIIAEGGTEYITEEDTLTKLPFPGNGDAEFFERAYSSICHMQVIKNKAYGNSALKPLNIFAPHHPYGARIDEKLARIQNSDELRKNDIADIIGGCMLLCREYGWDNFDDLID